MKSRYGKVYKPRGIAAKAARFLGVLLLVAVTLFFYLYFTWQNYIVYTDDGLYLDLPFMDDGDKPSGGKPGGSAPVADSLGGGASEGKTSGKTDEAQEAEGKEDAQSADPAAGDDSSAPEAGGEGEPTALPEAGGAGDSPEDKPTGEDEPEEGGDEPAVPDPGDTAEPENDKPEEGGIRDSFI